MGKEEARLNKATFTTSVLAVFLWRVVVVPITVSKAVFKHGGED